MSGPQFRPAICALFVGLEVLLYQQSAIAQTLVALAEYAFVFFVLVRDRRVGVMYLVSFTLLAFGEWTYVTSEVLPSTFWGLRLGGISMNFVFLVIVSVWSLAVTRFRIRRRYLGRTFEFLVGFGTYAAVVGVIAVLARWNYGDNFRRDAAVYVSVFLDAYLLSLLTRDDVVTIAKVGIALTVASMFLSLLLHRTFQYGTGESFVLMNAFAFIVLYAVFFARRLYATLPRWLLIVALVILVVSGNVFLGGKAIVLFLAALLWAGLSGSRAALGAVVVGVLLLVFIGPILSTIAQYAGEDSLVLYKINQVYSAFQIADVDILSASQTSLGNIVAEGRSLAVYLRGRPLALLFGKGFGGGLPDVAGLLNRFTGAGAGYSDQDSVRNEFVRMHLPLFEILLKAGLLGATAYIATIVSIFRRRTTFSFVTVALLLTVFTNSKDMLLLTLLFGRLAERETAVGDTETGTPNGSRFAGDQSRKAAVLASAGVSG